MTVEGQIMGTPAYMSPEQAKGEGHRVDRRTDVYSLGAVLFEQLTGEQPFRGNVRMLLKQVIEDEPPSPRKFDGRIPRDLETICLKCLQKEPRRRYATAKELADELQRFLDGEPIRARRIGGMARTWRWCKRYPVVAGLLGLSAVLLLLAASGWYSETLQRRLVEKRVEQYRRGNYNLQLSRTWQFRDKSPEMVSKILNNVDHCPWDLRDFTWRLLANINNKDAVSVLRQATPSTVTVFSPDGKMVATAKAGTVQLWEAATGKLLATIVAHRSAVNMMAFSADGALLAAASRNGDIKLIRTPEGKIQDVTRCFPGHGARFFPQKVVGHEELWRSSAGGVDTWPGSSTALKAIAFSADKNLLATAGTDGHVDVWEVFCWQENERTISLIRLLSVFEGCVVPATGLVFSPDGERLAMAFANTIEVSDVKGQGRGTLRGHNAAVLSMIFSHDGKTLASGGADKRVIIWDLATAKPRLISAAYDGEVDMLAFSGDDQTLISAGRNWGVRRTSMAEMPTSGNGNAAVGDSLSPIGPANAGVSAADASRRTSELKKSPHGSARWETAIIEEPGILPEAISADGRLLAFQNLAGEIEVRELGGTDPKATIKTGTPAVASLAFSPDQKRLAAASWDGHVVLWNVTTGSAERVLRAHTDAVCAVAYSPDGKILATAGADGLVKLWDSETACLRGTRSVWDRDDTRSYIAKPCRPVSLAFSADGALLAASTEEKTITGWDLRTGSQIAPLSYRGYDSIGKQYYPVAARGKALAFSPDGRTLATASETNIELWDTVTSGHLASMPIKPSLGPRDRAEAEVLCLGFSSDGGSLAAACTGGAVRIFDLATHQLSAVLSGDGNYVFSVAFSPDGRTVASASSDGAIRLWDPLVCQERAILNANAASLEWLPSDRRQDRAGVSPKSLLDSANAVCFAGDGSMLATAGGDGTIRIWRGRQGTTLCRYDLSVGCLAFSPDGKTLLTIYNEVDLLTGQEVRRPALDTHALGPGYNTRNEVMSADGRVIATTGYMMGGGRPEQVDLWNAVTGRHLATLKAEKMPRPGYAMLSADGSTIAVRDFDTEIIKVWSIGGRTLSTWEGVGRDPTSALSPTGRLLVAGDEKGARVWDVVAGRELTPIPFHPVAFSPDGMILACANREEVILWDIASHCVRCTLPGPVTQLAFSPDGKRLATSGNTITVWDAEKGVRLEVLQGRADCLAFSPDGSLLAGYYSGELAVWRLGRAAPIAVSRPAGPRRQRPEQVPYLELEADQDRLSVGRTLQFAPDGSSLLTNFISEQRPRESTTTATTIQVWDGKSGRPRHWQGTSASFSPDSRYLLTTDGAAHLWDPAAGREVRRFGDGSQAVESAVFSPDGRQILTGSYEDRTAILWATETGHVVRKLVAPSDATKTVAFSPNGRQVFAGGQLWNPTTGEKGASFDRQSYAAGFAFALEGRQIVTGGPLGVILWDAADGREIRRLDLEQNPKFAVSPCGDQALVRHDDKFRLLDLCTDDTIREFDLGYFQTITLSNNGRLIATASGGGVNGEKPMVRLWETGTGKRLCDLLYFKDRTWAVVDADGRFDASNDGDVRWVHWRVGDERIAFRQLRDQYYDPGLLGKILGVNKEPLRKVATFDPLKTLGEFVNPAVQEKNDL